MLAVTCVNNVVMNLVFTWTRYFR